MYRGCWWFLAQILPGTRENDRYPHLDPICHTSRGPTHTMFHTKIKILRVEALDARNLDIATHFQVVRFEIRHAVLQGQHETNCSGPWGIILLVINALLRQVDVVHGLWVCHFFLYFRTNAAFEPAAREKYEKRGTEPVNFDQSKSDWSSIALRIIHKKTLLLDGNFCEQGG